MKRRIVIVVCIMIVVGISSFMIIGDAQAQKIVIESMYKPPLSKTDGTGLIDLITKERFSRIGMQVDIQLVPSARALEQANSGVYDGDIIVSAAPAKKIQISSRCLARYINLILWRSPKSSLMMTSMSKGKNGKV